MSAHHHHLVILALNLNLEYQCTFYVQTIVYNQTFPNFSILLQYFVFYQILTEIY